MCWIRWEDELRRQEPGQDAAGAGRSVIRPVRGARMRLVATIRTGFPGDAAVCPSASILLVLLQGKVRPGRTGSASSCRAVYRVGLQVLVGMDETLGDVIGSLGG
jgi:hypothetical protein